MKIYSYKNVLTTNMDVDEDNGYDALLSSFFTPFDCTSCLDGFTEPQILYYMIKNKGNAPCLLPAIQALGNIYSKKLGTPPILVVFTQNERSPYGMFLSGYRDINPTTRIEFNEKRIETSEPFVIYRAIIHEQRHAFQQYVCYNFFMHNNMPKSNLEKLFIICDLLMHLRLNSSKLSYEINPFELDAYIYDFEQFNYLCSRYESFKSLKLDTYLYTRMHSLLCKLEYDKMGLQNKYFKQISSSIRKDIYLAQSGKLGLKFKLAIDRIMLSGFDLNDALSYFTKKLDLYYDRFVVLAQKMREKGFDVSWEKNGNLLYVKASTQKYDTLAQKTMDNNRFYFKRNSFPQNLVEYFASNK